MVHWQVLLLAPPWRQRGILLISTGNCDADLCDRAWIFGQSECNLWCELDDEKLKKLEDSAIANPPNILSFWF